MKKEALKIETYCMVKNNRIVVDGHLVFEDQDAVGLKAFAKTAYRHLKPSYNKFFKMDEISKLAFVAAEFLLKDVNLEKYKSEELSVVLSNSESTMVTDKNHQQSISDKDNFFPSPSVFVYTLPNIMIGEISIRHNMKGENAFFIVENFNADLIANHINNLFLTNKSSAFIGGWVNYSDDKYEAFLYLASESGSILHNASEIEKIFKINH